MTNRLRLAAGVCAALMATGAGANSFDWGGDLRVRFTTLDEIPTHIPGVALDQGFNRDRIRLWAKFQPSEDVTLYGRLINEWRWYDEDRRQAPTSWDPVTETLPDQLYGEFKNLAGGALSLKIGRQSIKYGSGKIIADGTQLDGSRTDFLDGVKATVKFEQNEIDLLGVYSASEPGLVINDQDRKLVPYDSYAFGLYGKNKQFEQVPFEYYWIYKNEDDSATSLGVTDDASFHTFGARVMPNFGNGLAANVELAFQNGDHGVEDIEGTLLDASLSFSPGIWGDLKPKFSAGYYYLSGNDPSSSENESWHPVYSQIPQFGELHGYSYVGSQYGPFGWSNLSAPWVGLDMKPFKNAHLLLRYYKLGADESDGPGGGDDRGDSFWALLLYKITPNLSGHLWAEYLNTGDYYTDGADDALFARVNFEYKF
jgi:hypothetical protein